METIARRTPLYEAHKKLGGRIVDFAGWELPVQYSSALDEHMAVRSAAGLFDISHMGEFSLKGKDSTALLEKLIPTNLAKLVDGKGMYSCLCNETGGVIDDFFIFRISSDYYYLVVNAGRRETDFAWLTKHAKGMEIELCDLSDATAKLDLQGPRSTAILQKVFSALSVPERFYFCYADFAGKQVMISNTGYTGEVGYELYIDSSCVTELWDALLEAGKDEGILPCGLASRDSLRLEASYSLYGHELSEDINPIEAGLGWTISSEKNYIGCDVLRRLKTEGSGRKIVCLEITGKGIPREGYRVQCGETDIGYITSGGFSPLLKKGIAFALLDTVKAQEACGEAVKIGSTVDIIVRDKPVAAQIVKRPFYTYNQ